MKSKIAFLEAATGQQTPVAEPITIVSSSASLDWSGLYIERGYSEQFFPDDVMVPHHYLVMLTSQAFTWEWKNGRQFKKHTMYPGQIWVNPAEMPFSHRIDSYSEFILLTVQPAKLLEALHGIPFKTPPQFERRYNMDDPQLAGLLHTLMHEAETGTSRGKLFIDSLLTALAVHFVKHYSVVTPRLPERITGLSPSEFNRVMEYLEAHLSDNISLNNMAQEVGLSKYYFSRLFKQTTGLTPYQYLLQRRIERAKMLLETDSRSLSDIAHTLGFSDQSHFSRLFKRQYGLTPGNFVNIINR